MDQRKRLLIDECLGAVPGLSERLADGIHVADVGCGSGASTVTMAAAFPRSRFLGIEPDPGASCARGAWLRSVGFATCSGSRCRPISWHRVRRMT